MLCFCGAQVNTTILVSRIAWQFWQRTSKDKKELKANPRHWSRLAVYLMILFWLSPCSEGFPLSTKTNISNFQFDQNRKLIWKGIANTHEVFSMNIVTYFLKEMSVSITWANCTGCFTALHTCICIFSFCKAHSSYLCPKTTFSWK